jgi:hypothetical protein
MSFFSCCHSFCVVVFHALSFFSHCCFSRTTLLTLQISCYNYALFLSCCNPFLVATPLTLLLLLHCYFHHATPFMLFFSSHYSSQTIAHFKYLLIQPLLFFLCCCCYSFRATTLFCMVSMVFSQPLPCVSQSSKLWH